MTNLTNYRAEQIADEAARRLEQTLKPCPFCGSKQTIEKIAQDGVPGYMLQHMCCMIRPSWWAIKEEAIKAWNTRACDECERGAIPATEENMVAHGWVKKERMKNLEQLCCDLWNWDTRSTKGEELYKRMTELGLLEVVEGDDDD